MARLVALLRAINVGGHVVKMDRLRTLFAELGLADVETFIASGNVLFTTRAKGGPALERRIEAHLEQALGYGVRTFVRSGAELAAVVNYAAFAPAMVASAGALHVGFLAEPLDHEVVRAVLKLSNDIDAFHVNGREVYWLCRGTFNESTIAGGLMERTLKARITFRNTRTVARLAALCATAEAAAPQRALAETGRRAQLGKASRRKR